MVTKEKFIDEILTGTQKIAELTAAPTPNHSPADDLMSFGFTEPTKSSSKAETNSSFAQRLLVASDFGLPEMVQTKQLIRGTDAVAKYLPERAFFWPKTQSRPYQTLLFETDMSHKDLLTIPAFRSRKMSHLDIVEDALARMVSEALEGFQKGGEGVKADVRQGRKEETLCIVSVRDEREQQLVRLVCFGTVNAKTAGLETFHLSEQTRHWDQQLAKDHLGLLYERQFKKLGSASWQEAFTTSEEREQAENLLKVCCKNSPTVTDIQESVLNLLDTIAKGFGLRKKSGHKLRLQAFDLPSDHDIGIDPEELTSKHGGRNPFGGISLRDDKNRLLGYIVYPLKKKEDADQLRSYLEKNNRFHNVLVVFPEGEETTVELWQGKDQLAGKLRKNHGFKDAAQVVSLLSRFFVVSKAKVKNPSELAQELAFRARYLRRLAKKQLEKRDEKSSLRDLYSKFKRVLVHNQTEDEFADAYAQTLTYGLLSARWISKDDFLASGERFTRESAVKHMPSTSIFLREFFQQVLSASFEPKLTWLLEDIANLLDRTDIEGVFSEAPTGSSIAEDPVIHFYEPFLGEYDYGVKMDRGVFYTPGPVVAHIVESIDKIIRNDWGLPLGLADYSTQDGLYKVVVLDPAVGTGTFLRQVILRIYRTMMLEAWRDCDELEKKQLWAEYVRKHLLTRIYGFELIVAPFAICHMRLARTLHFETGFDLQPTDQLQVRLTNALDDILESDQQMSFEFGFLSDEAMAARTIKTKAPITVILGNPPYAGLSSNLEPHHRRLVEQYKSVGGVKLKPRNPLQFEKNINDDYVKFIGLSQHLLVRSSRALLGMVTNHSYVEGEYHAGIRWSLLASFSQVHCLDCHGNKDKKEVSPDGTQDENLFAQITTGVAIIIASRQTDTTGDLATLWCGDLWGRRPDKFYLLSETTISSLTTQAVFEGPSYLFRTQNKLADEYSHWPSLDELLPTYSGATETGFDELLLAFTKSELLEKIHQFIRSPTYCIRKKALALEKGRAREIAESPTCLDIKNAENYIRRIQFRPFDWRYGYLKKDLLKTNAFTNMQKLSTKQPGLATTSKSKSDFGAFAVSDFFCHKMIQTYDRTFVFPLQDPIDTADYHCNIALLHSRIYAERYKEMLRVGLPRVPQLMTKPLSLRLSAIGADIVALETGNMNYPYTSWSQTKSRYKGPVEMPVFEGVGRKVERRKLTHEGERLQFAEDGLLKGVPRVAWEYKVGSFGVLDSWFRQREGRVLDTDEQKYIRGVVVCLSHLVLLQTEVDQLIEIHGGWPGAFQASAGGVK